MLLVRRTPDDVTGPDRAYCAALALHVAVARRANERLAKRMRVPIAARAGLEGYVRAARARWRGRLEELVDAHRAGEILRRPFGRRLRSVLPELHVRSFDVYGIGLAAAADKTADFAGCTYDSRSIKRDNPR